jgi:hypothetical protein
MNISLKNPKVRAFLFISLYVVLFYFLADLIVNNVQDQLTQFIFLTMLPGFALATFFGSFVFNMNIGHFLRFFVGFSLVFLANDLMSIPHIVDHYGGLQLGADYSKATSDVLVYNIYSSLGIHGAFVVPLVYIVTVIFLTGSSLLILTWREFRSAT